MIENTLRSGIDLDKPAPPGAIENRLARFGALIVASLVVFFCAEQVPGTRTKEMRVLLQQDD